MADQGDNMNVDNADDAPEDQEPEVEEPIDEAIAEAALTVFKARLMTLVGLAAGQCTRIVEQGIDSSVALTIFDDAEIDGIFATQHLRATAKIRLLRLKGLAEWLRDKYDRGLGTPIEQVHSRSD
jgi:hypothetical protein